MKIKSKFPISFLNFPSNRESAILSDENTTSESSKYQIANTIAHEMAHQWFGNLVTMKWWTDLWLNEGFATYAASLAVQHVSAPH